MNFLVLEDDQVQSDLFCILLREYGHAVFVAKTVAEAKKLLATNSIDVVISDFNLANDETGVQFLAHVRRTRGAQFPFFLTSATPAKIPELENLAVTAFFQKNVGAPELIRRINKMAIFEGVTNE